MSKIKVLIWLIAFSAIQSNVYANEAQTNKQVIDSIFKSFYSKIAFKLYEFKISEINIVQNPDYQYFINILINELSDDNIKLSTSSGTTLKLNINEFDIKYLETNENLIRTINIDASIYILDKNGELKLLDNLHSRYNDIIEANEVTNIENEMFPFTKGKLPKGRKSFFDELIEPIIVVGATVLTVVLFFSVRTK